MVGHSHSVVNESYNGAAVGGANDAGAQVVRFDLDISKEGEDYTVDSSTTELISVEGYEASEELKTYASEYHEKTLEFLEDAIGTASDDFTPKQRVKGIPEAQLQDTAVIDLINEVQLEATGADVAGAALFRPNSTLKAGDLTYADIFDIYKYPNTLVGVEVTGVQLKKYMEWSAQYYNQYTEGDVTISFDPEIRGYNYDMFQGIDYKVDISKPIGQRIVDLIFKGKPLKDDDVVKLAVNNYRYGGLSAMGLITERPYFESDPKSLRSYIADTIRDAGVITPSTDDNWEIIGADLDHTLSDYIIGEVNAGNIELPVSEDGRSYNSKALNVIEMIEKGEIPESVLKEHGLIEDEEKPDNDDEDTEKPSDNDDSEKPNKDDDKETPDGNGGESDKPEKDDKDKTDKDKTEIDKDKDKTKEPNKPSKNEEKPEKTKDTSKEDEDGERLPKTATATWIFGLIGLGSVSLGSATHIFKKKVK